VAFAFGLIADHGVRFAPVRSLLQDFMSMRDVYHYGTQQDDPHRRQLTRSRRRVEHAPVRGRSGRLVMRDGVPFA
jgi:hypothetical protein